MYVTSSRRFLDQPCCDRSSVLCPQTNVITTKTATPGCIRELSSPWLVQAASWLYSLRVWPVREGRGYFAECELRNAESCQGVICGKSSAEHSANYPLSLCRIPQLKNSAFPQIAKLPFARIVQHMRNRCIAASGVPGSFPSVLFVIHLPKNRVITISTNFKVSSFCIPSVMSFR